MLEVFKNMRDLIGVISAYCRLESAVVDELENQHAALYALTQNQDMAKATRINILLRLSKVERAVFGKEQSPENPTEKALVKP